MANINRRMKLALSVGAAVIVVHSPAMAQSADANDTGYLGEIVVTARKASEPLNSVPVSVSVVREIELRNNIANDLTKIAEIVPQVTIGNVSAGTGSILTIRGISSSPSDAGVEQSVSVAIDGVQVSRGRIISQSMFDLRQVEVLEGPQALFFGKNSPAGVIVVHSADPTDKVEGYLRGGYEFEAREKYGEGAISGPLSDTLKARLAFRAAWIRGWLTNVAVPTANPFAPGTTTPGASSRYPQKGHNIAGRATLLWEPSDSFKANFKATIGDQKSNSGGAYLEAFCTGGQTNTTVLGIPDPGNDCKLNQRKSASDLPANLAVNHPHANGGVPYAKSRVQLYALSLDKQFDHISLSSTTGYYHQKIANADGFDGTFVQVFGVEAERYRLFTQELRADIEASEALKLTIGGYYDRSRRYQFNSPFLRNVGIDPLSGSYAAFQRDAYNKGETISAFGQARWKMVESVELAAGARWTHEKKSVNLGNRTLNPGYAAAFRAAGNFIRSKYSDDDVSPEVTLSWQPRRNALFYAAFKTGYKSGGLSNSSTLLASYTADSIRFQNEKALGFEGGAKLDLMDGKAHFELNAYRYK